MPKIAFVFIQLLLVEVIMSGVVCLYSHVASLCGLDVQANCSATGERRLSAGTHVPVLGQQFSLTERYFSILKMGFVGTGPSKPSMEDVGFDLVFEIKFKLV